MAAVEVEVGAFFEVAAPVTTACSWEVDSADAIAVAQSPGCGCFPGLALSQMQINASSLNFCFS